MNLCPSHLCLAAAACLILPSVRAQADERKLDVTHATRLMVRDSMIGKRSTLLFYTFEDQHAVLQIEIGNHDTSFPVSARIHLFAENTGKEGIKRWINNQHSDGLFPEVPSPLLTQILPADQCRVTPHRVLGTEKGPIGAALFEDHEVQLEMRAYQLPGRITLTAFTEMTRVFVKKTTP